jgi:hypothetical protein
MNFNINDYLSKEDKITCWTLAIRRAVEQVGDAKQGDGRAMNSYGGRTNINARPYHLRFKHAVIGTTAECIASKCLNCEWTLEMGQYKGNDNPDLTAIHRGKTVKCEVRGTSMQDIIIYRPQHDNPRPDFLLIGITNLHPADKNNDTCKIGYAFFRDLKPLIHEHPEWIREKDSRNPYYAIPIEYFSSDFSEF